MPASIESPFIASSRRVPLFVLLFSAIVTGGLAIYLVRTTLQNDRATFENEVDTVTASVRERIGTTRTLLRGMVGLFMASESVEAHEFDEYVKGLRLREDFPCILGLGFSRWLDAESPQQANALLQREYGSGLSLWPLEVRDQYHAIVFIAPLDARNREALGFDMSTDPTRRSAMAQARDSGRMVASGKVSLVQEITEQKQAGFLIYLPIYRGTTEPASTEERRERLFGFVYSPLRAGDLLRGVLGSGRRMIDMEVFDGFASDENLMYSTIRNHVGEPYLTAERRIDVGGRPWLLRFQNRPAFATLSQAWLIPWIVLLAAGSTALLTAISLAQARARGRAEMAEAAQRQAKEDLHREREWLRATLSSIADGVVVVDRDERVVSMNPVAERLTGWRGADAIGRPLEAIVVFDLHRGEQPGIEAGTQPHVGEITLISRDGARTPVEHSTAPIRSDSGVGSGAVIVLRDVTERRQHDLAMRAREKRERERSNRLQQLADATPRLTSALTIDALVDAIEIEARRLLQAPAAELRLNGDAGSCEQEGGLAVELSARDGTRIGCLAIAARPDTAYDGNDRALMQQLAGIGAIAIRNVWLYEELRSNDRRKDEFLATLAHELRNPLAPICSSLELLRLAPQGEHAERARAVAERQARHMVRLIDDLLDLSRISRGTISLQRRPMVLASALEAALETAEPLIRARRHRLHVEPLDHSLWVDGDAARLAQIFANLLNNAANYTEPGGDIRVWMRRVDGAVEVGVRDNGIGIDPAQLPKVFDMFMQADSTLGRSGGLGIGLTLVKRLVRKHGGSVEARSGGRGQGSEFVVRLPLIAAPAVPADEGPGAAEAFAEARRHRLLVVDDNRDAAESLAAMLRLDGYQVETAYDGPAAVDMVGRHVPEAVLLDIGLPGMNGYEVAQRLRAEHGPALRLIAITGWGQQADRNRAAAAGFDRHLVKPVEYAALKRQLQTLLAA